MARWSWGDDVAPLGELVARGGILAIPTESSYGIAVDPSSAAAVAAVYDLKGRSGAKPLPVVIASPDQLPALGVDWPTPASGGLERLWPAALSLLLPTRADVPAAAGSGRLAIRVPAHDRLRRLLAALGSPLTATSANPAGEAPVLDPHALVPLLSGRDAMIVDDGVLPGGPPSTLVEVVAGRARVLRPGRVDGAEMQRAAPALVMDGEGFSAATVEIPVEESS